MLLSLTWTPASSLGAEAIYAQSGSPLKDGRFGPVSQFQSALRDHLTGCTGQTSALQPDGEFGPATVAAIRRVVGCPAFNKIATDDPARQGKLTDTLWTNLLPGVAQPKLDARVQTLVLSYEATDYTSLEWNFCQNRPLFDPSKPGSRCFSNDPHSFITWGPRGATAGGGREVQAIVWLALHNDPTLLQSSFVDEAAAVQRMIGLSPTDTEKMLCTVWISQARRQVWTRGFGKLGAATAVRRIYDNYYRSARSDGSKIKTFFELYRQAGFAPTEVDYGFFVDRATETSAPSASALPALAAQMRETAQGSKLPGAIARLTIARSLPAGNADLRADRLGRDVAFLLDSPEASSRLTAAEKAAWSTRGRYRASDVGLSEQRAAPDFQLSTPDFSGMPQPGSSSLTAVEQTACPSVVLNPLPPPKLPQ